MENEKKTTTRKRKIQDAGKNKTPVKKKPKIINDFDVSNIEQRRAEKKRIPQPRKRGSSAAKTIKVSTARKQRATAEKETTAIETFSEESEDEVKDFDKNQSIVDWSTDEVLADVTNISVNVAHNITVLLDDGNTIPFIARYRKGMINHMDARKLQEVADQYESLKDIQVKINKVYKKINDQKKMTPSLEIALRKAKTNEEIDFLYYPYKTGSKKTLAETARNLGLEPLALDILEGNKFDLQKMVNPEVTGLSNLHEVETGVKHILADLMAKKMETLESLKKRMKNEKIFMQCHESISSTKAKKEKKMKVTAHSSVDQSVKFENYFNYNRNILFVKPHEVLAINRGEDLKILTVKIIFPDRLKNYFEELSYQNLIKCHGIGIDNYRQSLISYSIDDAYKRLVEPLLIRQIRSELTKIAEKSALDVFINNLRQLLLTPPVRGKIVLGIDPGFRNGCKIGVISATGEILHTDVVYLPKEGHNEKNKNCENTVKNIVLQFCCNIVAIGNGTACRQTEELISRMIKQDCFKPLDVCYCIVNESGASIYSITEEAVKEMPELDPNLRSAVSIARRLQDPLAEYVKVEPKHLGVGMYQHDLTESTLRKACDSVVVECVSFVGVDLNTGSEALLRKVAGLNTTRAKNIIKWRTENGPFINREQLKKIKNLGPKSFEQCAGFIRIVPLTSLKNLKTTAKQKPNLLDATCIHPESYHVAISFLKMLKENLENIGTKELIDKINNMKSMKGIPQIASELKVDIPLAEIIISGLTQPLNYDMRSEFSKPLFKKEIMSFDDLTEGIILTGRVCNVVHFGAFIDLGVGRDGLIHSSQLKKTSLCIGDKVEVKVISADFRTKRIQLAFLQILK